MRRFRSVARFLLVEDSPGLADARLFLGFCVAAVGVAMVDMLIINLVIVVERL